MLENIVVLYTSFENITKLNMGVFTKLTSTFVYSVYSHRVKTITSDILSRKALKNNRGSQIYSYETS